jgi:hypothetical protein
LDDWCQLRHDYRLHRTLAFPGGNTNTPSRTPAEKIKKLFFVALISTA